uniref:Uncharacterized protein n=1 Tax=Setaria italica TaxID=4555 RepID=K3YWV2_SETIT
MEVTGGRRAQRRWTSARISSLNRPEEKLRVAPGRRWRREYGDGAGGSKGWVHRNVRQAVVPSGEDAKQPLYHVALSTPYVAGLDPLAGQALTREGPAARRGRVRCRSSCGLRAS